MKKLTFTLLLAIIAGCSSTSTSTTTHVASFKAQLWHGNMPQHNSTEELTWGSQRKTTPVRKRATPKPTPKVESKTEAKVEKVEPKVETKPVEKPVEKPAKVENDPRCVNISKYARTVTNLRDSKIPRENVVKMSPEQGAAPFAEIKNDVYNRTALTAEQHEKRIRTLCDEVGYPNLRQKLQAEEAERKRN